VLEASDETQDTSNRKVYMAQGSIAPIQTIQLQVKSMMACIKKLVFPFLTTILNRMKSITKTGFVLALQKP